MHGGVITTGDIAREYCGKWEETPSLTLAKKLYKEHKTIFRDIEHARSQIRQCRGQMGEHHRKATTDKSLYQKPGSLNPFELPKSYAKKRTPIELEGNRFLMLYDIHIPYHDIEALQIAIEAGKDCDTIFLGGDTMDCHLISKFVHEPDAPDLAEELKLTIQFFGYLRDKFPKAKIYYKEGNHEERYWKFMRVKAPELLDIKAMTMQSLLRLEDFGIEWLHGRTKANIGKLSVFHGHEFGNTMFSPVNVARGLYLRAKASSICGHSHQTSEHTERDVNDKMITCWSVGSLSELSPEYAPYNKWCHGFAIIEKHGTDFHVRNNRIYNGKLL